MIQAPRPTISDRARLPLHRPSAAQARLLLLSRDDSKEKYEIRLASAGDVAPGSWKRQFRPVYGGGTAHDCGPAGIRVLDGDTTVRVRPRRTIAVEGVTGSLDYAPVYNIRVAD